MKQKRDTAGSFFVLKKMSGSFTGKVKRAHRERKLQEAKMHLEWWALALNPKRPLAPSTQTQNATFCVWICVDTQSQCLLCENHMKMLFLPLFPSYVLCHVLRHKCWRRLLCWERTYYVPERRRSCSRGPGRRWYTSAGWAPASSPHGAGPGPQTTPRSSPAPPVHCSHLQKT